MLRNPIQMPIEQIELDVDHPVIDGTNLMIPIINLCAIFQALIVNIPIRPVAQ